MKSPPNDTAAEVAILAAVMANGTALDGLDLDPDEFYSPRHQDVWRAMLSLRGARKPVDTVSVADELTRAGHFERIGGYSTLGEINDNGYTGEGIEHHAGLVREAATKRRVLLAASELVTRAYRADVSADDLLGNFAQAARSVEGKAKDGTLSMAEAIRVHFGDYGKLLQAKASGEAVSLKLRTGLRPVDDLLAGGLPLGTLSILAGRPSQGKSALARTLADGVNQQGGGVHVFSTEDTCRAYVMRALADHADVDLARMWALDVSRGEWGRIDEAAGRLYLRRGWLIDDARGLTIGDICRRVRKRARDNGTRLVVIDFAQIIGGPGRDERERIGAVSQGAADLAREENCAVLLLSQLNRESLKRGDCRPTLGDLKGSGDLEEDADVVLMVHRPEHYLLQQDQGDKRVQDQLRLVAGIGELLCEKAKNGPTGTAVLRWNKTTATYWEMTR